MPQKLATDTSAETANGDYYHAWPGGRGVFRINGTWDTATATLGVRMPDGSYLPVGADTTFTSDDAGQFFLASGSIVAVTLSSVGGSTSLQWLVEEAE